MHEKLTWYKQSAYKWKGEGMTVYIDPWRLRKGQEAPADVIFITHAHSDHFEPEDIEKIRKSSTQFVAPRDVAEKLEGNVKAIGPGDSFDVAGIKVEAVRAYNTAPQRLEAHPNSSGRVGYKLSLHLLSHLFSLHTHPYPHLH